MKYEILLAGIFALGSLAIVRADEPVPPSPGAEEGLVPVKVQGLDQVYAQPDANLSGYNKIILDPVEVSFRKDWKPDRAGGPITASERQVIRQGLAKIFRQVFTKELQQSGGYPLVTQADTNVLRIKAEIRDLYINAPDTPRAGPSRIYAISAGEMRLVAELRDSATESLIARVIDLKRDPDAPWIHLTTRVSNVAAAQSAIAEWAMILRKSLDAAHALHAMP